MLGDEVEKALAQIGITSDSISNWLGRPCNCKRRKRKLNLLEVWARRVCKGQLVDAGITLRKIIDGKDQQMTGLWKGDAFSRHMQAISGVEYIFDPKIGCIAWNHTTGDNIEILELEAALPHMGQGLILYRRLVERIHETKKFPRHSVVGYRRTENEQAEHFYKKMGWNQIDLGHSLYPDGPTTLLWTTWSQLVKRVHYEGK